MDVTDAIAGSSSGVEPQVDLAPGDHVRSYDFPGNRTCYIVGVIDSITERIEGCERYKIRVTRQVFDGQVRAGHPEFIFPPVNGTPTLMGRMTNGVERELARDTAAP